MEWQSSTLLPPLASQRGSSVGSPEKEQQLTLHLNLACFGRFRFGQGDCQHAIGKFSRNFVFFDRTGQRKGPRKTTRAALDAVIGLSLLFGFILVLSAHREHIAVQLNFNLVSFHAW